MPQINLSQVFSQVTFTNNYHKLGIENYHKYLWQVTQVNYHKYHSVKLSQVFSQVTFTNNDHKLGIEHYHKYQWQVTQVNCHKYLSLN